MGYAEMFEEDDGIDLSVPQKATLEELELEEEQAKPVLTKAEKKQREKKQTKFTFIIIGGIVAGFAIIATIVYFMGKKGIIRELPFMVAEGGAVDENDIELNDGDWYVGNQQAYGIYGRITDICNMYDKPTSYGNSIQSFNVDDIVFILGDTFNSKNKEMLNYYYVKANDKKGYVSIDKLAIVWDNFEETYVEEETEQEEELPDEEMTAEKEAFYMEKAAEHMTELDSETEERGAVYKRYSYLQERVLQINKQLTEGINFEEGEDGNIYIIEDYPYTPEEIMALQEELSNIQNELASLEQQIEAYESEN